MLVTILRIYAQKGLNNFNLRTMKHNYLYTIGLILSLIVVVTSCKKDRSPRLIVDVREQDGTVAPGAQVHAWYGGNAGQPGSVLNDALMNQTANTDGAGQAIFEFKFSAVLDVDVIYYKETPDSINPTIIYVDTLTGSEVVKIESVRQKSEENDYNVEVVVE